MIANILFQFFRFLLLVLVQVLILNNLQLNGVFNPYIYPLFILLLPIGTPLWLLLLLGFGMGITIDLFSNTMGMHAAAATLLAYMRPQVLKLIQPSGGYQPEDSPALGYMGFRWFITYISILIVIHHLCFFFLETLGFPQFFFMLLKIMLSTILSISLIVASEYLLGKRKLK